MPTGPTDVLRALSAAHPPPSASSDDEPELLPNLCPSPDPTHSAPPDIPDIESDLSTSSEFDDDHTAAARTIDNVWGLPSMPQPAGAPFCPCPILRICF